MKIRTGFVSNSSSSSFICDITGNIESGCDMCLADIGMAECENGHTFMTYLAPGVEDWIDECTNGDHGEDFEEDSRYQVPAAMCPICNGSAKHTIINRMKNELARLNVEVSDLL